MQLGKLLRDGPHASQFVRLWWWILFWGVQCCDLQQPMCRQIRVELSMHGGDSALAVLLATCA